MDGVKPPIHFHCVLHAKRGRGVQKACTIAYVLNGRPLKLILKEQLCGQISWNWEDEAGPQVAGEAVRVG